MRCPQYACSRPWSIRSSLIVAMSLGLFLGATAAGAQEIVKVEEDWELVIGSPDADNDSPQLTCVVSPTGDLNSLYMALDLNHHTLPVYNSGGFQLQVWNDDVPVATASLESYALLNRANEKVTWTSRMSVGYGVLSFDVVGGSSTTWGAFGEDSGLQRAVTTQLTNLNAYDPAVSVANSRVGFGGNRVKSLVLTRVRLYTSTGDVVEQTLNTAVHEHP